MGGDAQFPSPLHRRFSDLVFILKCCCSIEQVLVSPIGFQTAPYVVVLVAVPTLKATSTWR